MTTVDYQVIEDNSGSMYLFFFDKNDKPILGIENIEYAQPGDLDNITLSEARTWDSQLFQPGKAYNNITSFNFGWQVVADQDGVYPDRMGRAAQILFKIDAEKP